jgi:hypothetical protein
VLLRLDHCANTIDMILPGRRQTGIGNPEVGHPDTVLWASFRYARKQRPRPLMMFDITITSDYGREAHLRSTEEEQTP